ncbi:BspA family leucine-rich repeat surface protein [Ruminococcaceae bacterium OttesenSCG-928-A11]|nr:BspA family leucine-rich repeat surface protein [Ruminococcaceae bacterium OttesenSCG-928-A11]
MHKFFAQIKPLIVSLLVLLIGGVVSVLLFAIFGYSPAQAESIDSDLNVQVDGVLAISLVNCDATNSSVVGVDVTPSSAGTFKSACQTVLIDTNNPGYSLTVKASSLPLNYQNPTTIDPKPTIPATANTIASPGVLANDTWGFAVENAPDLPNFDTTYTVNNASNKFAALPTTETPIYSTDEFPIPLDNHKFYYATKLTPDTMAGTYMTTITYTAVGEAVQPVPCENDSVICIRITDSGTIALGNVWSSPISYTINNSEPIFIEASGLSNDINVLVGDIIEIAESVEDTSFRSWSCSSTRSLVTNTTSTSTAKASIAKMPPMNRFTTDNTGTIAGDCFFRYFANGSETYPAAVNSLPKGGFDTSNIISAGNRFFYDFNYRGILTSLPKGSFNTSNITSVGDYFFAFFNQNGSLISLPENSFNINNITSLGNYFFYYFNSFGSLISLPENSFNINNITSPSDYFFNRFNDYGALTSLPKGSFNTSNITTVGNDFFTSFNQGGIISSLPTGSFNTSNITSVGDYFFTWFIYESSLNSLPTGSFDISNIKTVGNRFFHEFNSYGSLTSLPDGSFDISNITTVGNDFFNGFNRRANYHNRGALTSLPVGSFDTSNITSVGSCFFCYFNTSGTLTSLPAGSFNTSSITSVGSNFFVNFNSQSGALTSLPVGSFDTSNIITTGSLSSFFGGFNGGSLSNAGKLQAGTGVTITNKYSSSVEFWQRPFGNPDGTALNTSVPAGGTITFLAE